jgi:hypothetical protein
MVVLLNRRNELLNEAQRSDAAAAPVVNDPFAANSHFLDDQDRTADDYEWLEDELEPSGRAGGAETGTG